MAAAVASCGYQKIFGVHQAQNSSNSAEVCSSGAKYGSGAEATNSELSN